MSKLYDVEDAMEKVRLVRRTGEGVSAISRPSSLRASSKKKRARVGWSDIQQQDKSNKVVNFSTGKELVNLDAKYGQLKLTPLMLAAREGDCELVAELIQRGANPSVCDIRGYDALMYAVRDGHANICQLILDSLKQTSSSYGFLSKFGLSHILYASLSGHLEVVNTLGQYGCRVNIPDCTGITPLMGAAKNGHSLTINTLIEIGCSKLNLDAQDRYGRTALAWGVLEGNQLCVQTLITHGADVCLRDRCNRSPLFWAVSLGHTQIGKLLMSSGAQICNIVRLAILKPHLTDQGNNSDEDCSDSEISKKKTKISDDQDSDHRKITCKA